MPRGGSRRRVNGAKGDPYGGFCDVAAPSGRICYALRAGLRGGVYATVDIGATWKRQVLPTDTTAYEALEFVDATTGYAVGGAGLIAKTIDGGRSRPRPGARRVDISDGGTGCGRM